MSYNPVDAKYIEEEALKERLIDELIELNEQFSFCSFEDWDIKDLRIAIKQEKEQRENGI